MISLAYGLAHSKTTGVFILAFFNGIYTSCCSMISLTQTKGHDKRC